MSINYVSLCGGGVLKMDNFNPPKNFNKYLQGSLQEILQTFLRKIQLQENIFTKIPSEIYLRFSFRNPDFFPESFQK